MAPTSDPFTRASRSRNLPGGVAGGLPSTDWKVGAWTLRTRCPAANDASRNKYKVKCGASLEEWENKAGWTNRILWLASQKVLQVYQGRTDDDETPPFSAGPTVAGRRKVEEQPDPRSWRLAATGQHHSALLVRRLQQKIRAQWGFNKNARGSWKLLTVQLQHSYRQYINNTKWKSIPLLCSKYLIDTLATGARSEPSYSFCLQDERF